MKKLILSLLLAISTTLSFADVPLEIYATEVRIDTELSSVLYGKIKKSEKIVNRANNRKLVKHLENRVKKLESFMYRLDLNSMILLSVDVHIINSELERRGVSTHHILFPEFKEDIATIVNYFKNDDPFKDMAL